MKRAAKRVAAPIPPRDTMLLRDVATVPKTHGMQIETQKRYRKDYRIVAREFQRLTGNGCSPFDLEHNGSKVVSCLQKILMQRCVPKSKGYQGLSAITTGNVISSSSKMVRGSWFNVLT